MHRIFLLSPAKMNGGRAQLVIRPGANNEMARKLRSDEGIQIGELFSFLSGLYFRGKLAYARAFSRPPAGLPGAWVITPSDGLMPWDAPVRLADLQRFAEVRVDPQESRYTRPLRRDAKRLADALASGDELIFLGSISTDKYAGVLLEAFGAALMFPLEFVGRGDMSRGGLMLRCVEDGQELQYGRLLGAVRHGPRPARLPVRSRGGRIEKKAGGL